MLESFHGPVTTVVLPSQHKAHQTSAKRRVVTEMTARCFLLGDAKRDALCKDFYRLARQCREAVNDQKKSTSYGPSKESMHKPIDAVEKVIPCPIVLAGENMLQAGYGALRKRVARCLLPGI